VSAFQVTRIGNRLKELREASGMSQQSLAVAAGLSVSLVSQIERGGRLDPRISTISSLARVLGVSLDYLAGASAPGALLGPRADQRPRNSRRGAPEPRHARPA